MKKIIYSTFVFAGLAISSCSNNNVEIENKDKHSESESHEGHDHADGEHEGHDHGSEGHDHAEKSNFPVDGYSFYGMNEVIPGEAITVEEMVAKISSEGSFEGSVSAVLDGVCKKTRMLGDNGQ